MEASALIEQLARRAVWLFRDDPSVGKQRLLVLGGAAAAAAFVVGSWLYSSSLGAPALPRSQRRRERAHATSMSLREAIARASRFAALAGALRPLSVSTALVRDGGIPVRRHVLCRGILRARAPRASRGACRLATRCPCALAWPT
jgi:hypothetical protein